jgi:hypothetical protein
MKLIAFPGGMAGEKLSRANDQAEFHKIFTFS